MASNYTLHYFTVAARGEFIRFIFEHAGQEFTEKSYGFSDMPEIKSDDKLYPMGMLPTLELENGTIICESHAIVRYLGNKFNLYGNTAEEKVVIDQVMDAVKGLEEKLWGGYFWKKGDEQTDALKNAFENVAPRVFKLIENFLHQHNNKEKDFLVGKSVTIGDIHIMVAIETVLLENNKTHRNVLDNFPLTKALNEKVRASTNIKDYIEKRGSPVYKFK